MHALPNRINEFRGDAYGCGARPCAAERAFAVCSRSVWRGLVIRSLRWPAEARPPCRFVFGRAGVGRGRGGGIRALCRQRPRSVLSVAIGPCGYHCPFRTLPTSFRSAFPDSPVVRRARTFAYWYFLGGLWPLGRELERQSIKDTHRCFLPAPRPKRLLSNRPRKLLEMNATLFSCYSPAVKSSAAFSGANHAL